MSQSFILFSLPVTQSFAPIVALEWSRKARKSITFLLCTSLPRWSRRPALLVLTQPSLSGHTIGKLLCQCIIGQLSWNSTSSRSPRSKPFTTSNFRKTNLASFTLNSTAHLLNNLKCCWRTPPFFPCHGSTRSQSSRIISRKETISLLRNPGTEDLVAPAPWRDWILAEKIKTALLRAPSLHCTPQGKIL